MWRQLYLYGFLFIFYIRPTEQTDYPIILPGFAGLARSDFLEISNESHIFVGNFRAQTGDFEFRVAKRGQVGEKVKYKTVGNPFGRRDVSIELLNNSKTSDFYSLGIWTENDGFLVEAKLQPTKEPKKVVYDYIPCGDPGPVDECRWNNQDSVQLKVYPGNETILSEETYADEEVLFVAQMSSRLKCKEIVEYDPEEFMLLSNGDLWVRDLRNPSLLSQKFPRGQYCLNSVCLTDSGQPIRQTTAFLCEESARLDNIFSKIKTVCVILSAIATSLTCVIFVMVKSESIFPRLQVIGYSLTMTAFFIVRSIALILSSTNMSCPLFVCLYQYLSLISFTIVFLLIVETAYLVRTYNRSRYDGRFYYYVIAAVGFPVFMFVLSKLFPFTTINTAENQSCLMTSPRTVFLYFVPIVLLIVLSLVSVCWISFQMKNADQTKNVYWTRIRKDIKNLYRGCIILLILMVISWAAELISYFLGNASGILESLNIIGALQGVFTFLIFVLHNPLYDFLIIQFHKYIKPSDENANESREPLQV